LRNTDYLQQQHSFLQQVQSQLHLQDLPFSHPEQAQIPLQHLQSLSQHALFCFFIFISFLLIIEIYPSSHKQKTLLLGGIK
jgi:hypothetical protein